MSDCCSPSGCSAPAAARPVLLPGQPDRRNRAERRRDAKAKR